MTGFDPRAPYEVVHEDREYARPDGTPLLARVYRPVGASAPCPALVDVHGGAWTHFDRRADFYFDRALAACGMVVVALDFRQGPAHRYPSAIADVVAGVPSTKANAEELGARPERVGLIGGSSGGHVLMLAALRPTAPEFGTTRVAGADGVDARVDYALPLWPILDPHARYRYLLERQANPTPARDPFFQPDRLIEGHQGFFGDEATMAHASATRMVEAGEFERLPSVWLAHAEHDENVTLPMTERFVHAYRAAGGQIELEVFPGVGHAFANIPGEEADAAIARMRDFIATQ